MDDWMKTAGQLAEIGLPSLGTLIGNVAGGPLGGTIGGAVGKGAAAAIGAALGVAPTPTAISEKVATDPDGSRLALAQVEADAKVRLAELQDVASARQMLVALEQDHAASGKAPALLSLVSVVGFFAVVGALFFMTRDIPPNLNTLLSLVVGALVTRYGQVFDFWLGSSHGSQKKDAQIGSILSGAAAPGIPATPKR